MKFKLAFVLAAVAWLLTGCAGTVIGLRSTNSPAFGAGAPPPGSAYSSASIQAELRPGPYAGLLIFGYILAGIQDHYRHWGDRGSASKPPELAADRSVVERDCSQPLEPLYANLRCK